MKKAIYAGSFDPITNGHIDIVERALGMFSEIQIAVIHNPDKKALFTLDERMRLIKEVFKGHKQIVVTSFEGLLADYAAKEKIYTLIRGLRAVSDFDYEFQMALMNRRIQPKIDTVFFMTDTKYSYLSSSIVKQIAHFKGEVENFVPKSVLTALKRKFSK